MLFGVRCPEEERKDVRADHLVRNQVVIPTALIRSRLPDCIPKVDHTDQVVDLI